MSRLFRSSGRTAGVNRPTNGRTHACPRRTLPFPPRTPERRSAPTHTITHPPRRARHRRACLRTGHLRLALHIQDARRRGFQQPGGRGPGNPLPELLRPRGATIETRVSRCIPDVGCHLRWRRPGDGTGTQPTPTKNAHRSGRSRDRPAPTLWRSTSRPRRRGDSCPHRTAPPGSRRLSSRDRTAGSGRSRTCDQGHPPSRRMTSAPRLRGIRPKVGCPPRCVPVE